MLREKERMTETKKHGIAIKSEATTDKKTEKTKIY